jgi:hypothetical protein
LVVDSFTAVKNFDLKGVAKAYIDFAKRTGNLGAAVWDDINAQAPPLPTLAVGGKPKKAPPGGGPPLADLAKQEKARAELLKSQLDNELKIFTAKSELQGDIDKRKYENGLSSLAQYFDSRREMINAQNDKEIATLTAKQKIIAGLPDREPGDAEKKAKELAEIKAQIAEKQIERERKIKDAIQDESKATEGLRLERVQFEEKTLDLQGKRFDAAQLALAEESKAFEKMLRSQGVSDADRPHLIGQFETQGRFAIDFDQQKEKADTALADLARDQAAIQREVETGQLTQLDGEQKSVALHQQRLALLQQEADKLTAIALKSGDPGRIEQAKQLQEAVKDIGVAANKTGRDLAEVKAAVQQDSVSAGADFLNAIITKAKTASEAVHDFAQSVLASFTSIISKKLSEKLFASLFGGLGDLGGGILGLFGSGTASVGAGQSASLKAEGGKITGPGTGTSDSIPAIGPMGRLFRISNEEFIVRNAVVRQPGAEAFLRDFNRYGMRSLAIREFSRAPRFAGGGTVGGASFATGGVPAVPGVQVVISPGMAHMTLREWLEGHLAREMAGR